jgi:hypothetical protein
MFHNGTLKRTPATIGPAAAMAMRSLAILTATASLRSHGIRRTPAEIAARKVWYPPAAQECSTALESTDRSEVSGLDIAEE